jgi:transcriptional regulator with GAF, ATPase, and Fis domain
LIVGETGVGKELVAKAIHNLSGRREGPLIPVNLVSFPQELVASELFGYEKGAFTGAKERRRGRFELAGGGTLFLDEVADLPLPIQAKLLRILQEGTFERLGSEQSIRSNFRLIAATNKDLAKEVEKGRFRQDLFYRMNVFPIALPPLRGRKADIPSIASHLLDKYNQKMGKRIRRIPSQEMERLLHYGWPGNVRELEHVIERAVIISEGTSIDFSELDRLSGTAVPGSDRESMRLRDMERQHIKKALVVSGFRIYGPGGAAAKLDLKPTTLCSMMKRLGIGKRYDET